MSPFVRRPSVRHADRVLALSVFALTLAVFLATFRGLSGTAGEELAYQTTRSLARGGIALGATPEAREWVAAAARGEGAGTIRVRAGPGRRAEQSYAGVGLGHAALALPLYAAGWSLGHLFTGIEERHARDGGSELAPHLLVGLRNPLLTAWTAWLLVLIARRLGVSRAHAWLTGLTYALTSFAWPLARGGAPEVPAAFLLLLAFHLILRVRERLDRFEPLGRRELVGLGLALGAAWLTHPGARLSVVVLVAVAEVVLTRGCRRLAGSRWSHAAPMRAPHALALVLSPLLVLVLLGAWADHHRFGTWLDPHGLVGLLGPARGSGPGELLLSPGRGLLWTAPLVLLAPLGLRRARAEGEALFPRTLAALLACVLVPAIVLADGLGRWSFGPRPLLPVLPFLWIAVGLALPVVTERIWRARLAVAVGAFGFAVQLPAALVDEGAYVELARQAAPERWPVLAQETDPVRREDELWKRCAWSWRFAAPWVHWRLLRHRVSGQGEEIPARELFRVSSRRVLEVEDARSRGFRHLAWVDLVRRLGGSALVGVVLVLGLFLAGTIGAVRALDPSVR